MPAGQDGTVLRVLRRELGQRLRGVRVAAGYSQAQLALRAGYARSTVSTVEGGGQNAPRLFWERCDAILGTGTMFTAGYDAIARQAGGGIGGRAGGLAPLDGRLLDAATVAEVAGACRRLGWRTEAGHGRVSLLCGPGVDGTGVSGTGVSGTGAGGASAGWTGGVGGAGVDALEVPRAAGMVAARWWLHTGGQPDEIRGLPALPSPADALAVIAAGERWYFLVQAGACPWDPHAEGPHAEGPQAAASAGPGMPGGGGPVLRWHAEGSRVPVPPSRDEDGELAAWAYRPPARFRPADPVVLLGLLALAARVTGEAGVLTLPGGVRVLPASDGGRDRHFGAA